MCKRQLEVQVQLQARTQVLLQHKNQLIVITQQVRIFAGKDRGWFNPGPLANDEEEGRQSRDPAIQLAGQRAVKLNYTPPKT